MVSQTELCWPVLLQILPGMEKHSVLQHKNRWKEGLLKAFNFNSHVVLLSSWSNALSSCGSSCSFKWTVWHSHFCTVPHSGSAATMNLWNTTPFFLWLRKSGSCSELIHNKSFLESCSAPARTYLATAPFLSFSRLLDSGCMSIWVGKEGDFNIHGQKKKEGLSVSLLKCSCKTFLGLWKLSSAMWWVRAVEYVSLWS